MPKILSIEILRDECICSQTCVAECPEVLDGETPDRIPRVREDANQFFESHFEEIKMAAAVCPVEAVKLDLDES